MEGIRPSVWGSSALVMSGELCIATGACPNSEVMGSTSGTMTGYEIVNRAIHVCMLYCLLGVWLFFHVYCWPLLPLLLGDWVRFSMDSSIMVAVVCVGILSVGSLWSV